MKGKESSKRKEKGEMTGKEERRKGWRGQEGREGKDEEEKTKTCTSTKLYAHMHNLLLVSQILYIFHILYLISMHSGIVYLVYSAELTFSS